MSRYLSSGAFTVLILVDDMEGVATFQDGEFTCNFCNLSDAYDPLLWNIPKNATRINLNDNMLPQIML